MCYKRVCYAREWSDRVCYAREWFDRRCYAMARTFDEHHANNFNRHNAVTSPMTADIKIAKLNYWNDDV